MTGSDGKTTTTTLTAKLLEQSGKRVFLGGNIGKNLFARLDEIRPDDYAVAELSSFQLMKMTRSPDTAVVTNISPNHLDWHRDFDEYIAAKKRICASMPADGLLVLNYDNEHTRAFAASAGCRVRFFSRKNREAFCFIDGEGLHCGGRLLLPDGDIRPRRRAQPRELCRRLRRDRRSAGGRRADCGGAGFRRRGAPD